MAYAIGFNRNAISGRLARFVGQNGAKCQTGRVRRSCGILARSSGILARGREAVSRPVCADCPIARKHCVGSSVTV